MTRNESEADTTFNVVSSLSNCLWQGFEHTESGIFKGGFAGETLENILGYTSPVESPTGPKRSLIGKVAASVVCSGCYR